MVLVHALKPACSSAMTFSACGFSLFCTIFSMTLLGWLMRLIVRYFWYCCRLPFLGSVMAKDWVHGVAHSPVCQILLHIAVRAVITSSPPAWTSSAGMLSTPADFPFFNDCITAFTSLRRMGWSSSVSEYTSVQIDLRLPCDCTAQMMKCKITDFVDDCLCEYLLILLLLLLLFVTYLANNLLTACLTRQHCTIR